jgi:hypothetical protein
MFFFCLIEFFNELFKDKKALGNVPMKIRISLNQSLSCSKWRTSTIKNLYEFLEVPTPEGFEKELEIFHQKYLEKYSTRGRGRGRGKFYTRGRPIKF